MSLFSRLFRQNVVYRPFLQHDAGGVPLYGDPIPILCRLVYSQSDRVNAAGEVIHTQAVLQTAHPVVTQGKIADGARELIIQSVTGHRGLSGRIDHYKAVL